MKRLLLLVLPVLWLAADAGAVVKSDVFIYSFMQKSTDYTCDINGVADMNEINSSLWNKSIKTSTGYLIVQWNTPTSLSVWTVTMEKQKEFQDGKWRKCATFTSRPTEYSIAQAGLGKKTTWLLAAGSDMEQIFLTGDEKPVKLSGLTSYVATKLAGTRTWYYINDKVLHVGSAALTLRWQSRMTAEYYTNDTLLDGEDEWYWYGDYLYNKGYYLIDP